MSNIVSIAPKRPARISSKLRIAIARRVEEGLSIDDACQKAGMSRQSWYRSMKRPEVRDLYDIPEDRLYDNLLCTEVIEHVVDPVRAIEKMVRLVRPGGRLIVTAPFTSMTHFAPYHFATGFSRFFYQHHLDRLGFEIERIDPNGGFFDMLDQELGRARRVRRQYSGIWLDPVSAVLLFVARMNIRLLARLDGPRMRRRSAELQTFGWHVVARRRETVAAAQ